MTSPALTQQAKYQKELQDLLDSYPEEKSLDTLEQRGMLPLSVYSEYGLNKIADISNPVEHEVVRKKGDWLFVRFDSPTVPLWVSERYLNVVDGVATVDATRLNARQKPTIASPVIASFERGYQTKVLESRDGFAKVLASRDLVVAIADAKQNSNNSTTASITNGGWVSQSNSRAAIAGKGGEGSVLTVTQLAASQTSAKVPDETAKDISNPAPSDKSPSEESATAGVESRAQRVQSVQERQHLIAPGDAISLLVFGEQDLSVENVRVPESGRVSFPLIGSITVGGKTTQQVETILRSTLSEGYVKNPRLSVSIFSYRPIFIRGAVRSTGSFPYTEGLSIAKAIALAGGSKNSAKANGVSLLRDGETVASGLALDSPRKVASGDVITIAEELGVSEDPTLFIYLHGEVAKPGEYLYRRGLTVEKAVVLAGGFTLRGSQKKIKVTRYAGLDKDQEPIKVKGVKLYTPIEPGDVIKIGARWF